VYDVMNVGIVLGTHNNHSTVLMTRVMAMMAIVMTRKTVMNNNNNK